MWMKWAKSHNWLCSTPLRATLLICFEGFELIHGGGRENGEKDDLISDEGQKAIKRVIRKGPAGQNGDN